MTVTEATTQCEHGRFIICRQCVAKTAPAAVRGACPSWCIKEHDADEHPDDFEHYGIGAEVPLANEPLVEGWDGFVSEWMDVYLEAKDGADPGVHLSRGGTCDFLLTIDEARSIARTLLVLCEEVKS